MKVKCKQTIAKFFPPLIVILFLFAGAITLFTSSTSYAPTKLSDTELSDVEGQALFDVTHYQQTWFADNSETGGGHWVLPSIPFGSRSYETQSQDVVRLNLGLEARMDAHMKSFKMGYYYGNNTGSLETGWDQDTTNYFWGNTNYTSATNQPLRWDGVFIDFGFDNYSNNSTRVLNYVEIGTMSSSGFVTGTINTVTGLVGGGTGANSGLMLRQTAAGQRIITYENEVLSFVFATKYQYVSSSTGGIFGTHPDLKGIFIKMPDYDTTADLTRP
jgi:hypothetical protein